MLKKIKSFIQGAWQRIWQFLSLKRVRFLISALILSGALLFVQTSSFGYRYQLIGGLAVLAFGLSYWSLREGINSFLISLATAALPALFSVGAALFYFLFPESLYYRVFLLGFFAFTVYVIFLTENIFTVASIRTIALLRTAHTVGFLITLLTAFFFYNTVFSFRFFPWWNMALVVVVSFPLLIQLFWAQKLAGKISKKTLLFSSFSSLFIGQMALMISFYPADVLTRSLFLTCVLYIISGLGTAKIKERFFHRTVKEYLIVGGLMLAVLLLTISWRG